MDDRLKNGWRIVKLGDVCKEITSGGAAPQGEQYFIDGKQPFVRVADMGKLATNEKYIGSTKDRLNEKGIDKLRQFPSGSVLFTKSGASLLLNQRAILKTPSYVVSHIGVIVPNDEITSDWLYYSMKMIDFAKYCHATTLPSLKLSTLKEISIMLPPITEQRHIIYHMEEFFVQLDKAEETLLTAKSQLSVYRQAVLKDAFGSLSVESQKLEDLCFFITKGTTPSKNKMSQGKGEIPFIKVYNLTFDNTLDFSLDPTFVDEETHNGFLARSIVFPGDVLMNIVGPPMGKVSIVPDTYPEWNINQAIARFRCGERLNNKYLAYYLGFAQTVETMKKQSKATAGQFNLTLEICRNLTIQVPPIAEQKRIVYDIETRLSQCEKIQKTIDDAIQRTTAMRQSILKIAFEGRLN